LPRNLDAITLAISDRTRRAVLERLAHGPARLSDLAAAFPMTLTGFCKHVRVLERAKLVRRTHRGRENTLALNAEPLRDVAEWIFNYEKFWNDRLDRLERYFSTRRSHHEAD
jgi:DNA-binding transcriptional ArsR family regulator